MKMRESFVSRFGLHETKWPIMYMSIAAYSAGLPDQCRQKLLHQAADRRPQETGIIGRVILIDMTTPSKSAQPASLNQSK